MKRGELVWVRPVNRFFFVEAKIVTTFGEKHVVDIPWYPLPLTPGENIFANRDDAEKALLLATSNVQDKSLLLEPYFSFLVDLAGYQVANFKDQNQFHQFQELIASKHFAHRANFNVFDILGDKE